MLQQSALPHKHALAQVQAAKAARNAFVILIYGNRSGDVVGLRTVMASARRHGSTADQVALTPHGVDGLPQAYREILASDGIQVLEVPVIPMPEAMLGPVVLFRHQELVLTKFHVLNLTQYDRVVLLDTDTLFSGLAPPDQIFEVCGDVDVCMSLGSNLTDLPDMPTECLPQWNAGVMVVKPSVGLFNQLLDAIARETRRMSTPDQLVLACYIHSHPDKLSFQTLPWKWNPCTAPKAMIGSAYIIHWCGVANKPWNCAVGESCGAVQQLWVQAQVDADPCAAAPGFASCIGDSGNAGCQWCGYYCMDRRIGCTDKLFHSPLTRPSRGARGVR